MDHPLAIEGDRVLVRPHARIEHRFNACVAPRAVARLSAP
jgi:hypothetical protein